MAPGHTDARASDFRSQSRSPGEKGRQPGGYSGRNGLAIRRVGGDGGVPAISHVQTFDSDDRTMGEVDRARGRRVGVIAIRDVRRVWNSCYSVERVAVSYTHLRAH